MATPMPPGTSAGAKSKILKMKAPATVGGLGKKRKASSPVVKLKSKVSVSIKGGKSEHIAKVAKMVPAMLRGMKHASKGSLLEDKKAPRTILDNDDGDQY